MASLAAFVLAKYDVGGLAPAQESHKPESDVPDSSQATVGSDAEAAIPPDNSAGGVAEPAPHSDEGAVDESPDGDSGTQENVDSLGYEDLVVDEDEAALHSKGKYIYMATLRGKNFGDDEQSIAIRVNGVPVLNVVLHNDTALSFAIPTILVENTRVRETSFLEVSVRDTVLIRDFPLTLLTNAFEKVPSSEFRARSATQRQAEMKSGSSAKGSFFQTGYATESSRPSSEANTLSEPADAGSDEQTRESEKTGAEPEHVDPADEYDPELTTVFEEVKQLLLSDIHANARAARDKLEFLVKKEDPRGMALLASLLLAGDAPGFSRDWKTAVPLLKRSAERGFSEGQALLGFLHASGLASPFIPKDSGIALVYWTVAAEGGSNLAKVALAYRYHTGTDVPEDCEKAAAYYRDVASDVVYSAHRKLKVSPDDESRNGMALIRPPTPRAMTMADRKRLVENMEPRPRGEANEIIQYYKHAAERGDSSAQVMIGNLYYHGAANMPQNLPRARQLFERAARAGHNGAHAHMGFMDLEAGKNDSAVTHLRIAASAGEKLGLHGMGYVTWYGIGVQRDEALAAIYFSKAAEAEHPEAMYNLGLMYTNGNGVKESPEEAFRYFQQAARYGHLQSNFIMGVKILEGSYPAKRDCALAVTKYLRDVAQQGNWNRVLSTALRSFEKGAYSNALYRYLQAAHAGVEIAQYNAAFMFEHNFLYNKNSFQDNVDRMKWSLWNSMRSPYFSQPILADKLNENESEKPVSGFETIWTRADAVTEALDLYQMSSSQGYSHSLVRMGDLAYGEGKDFARATYAYERASRMRNAEAMFSLGWMHARGFGVKPDANLAKRYFDQAKATDPEAIIPATIAVFLLQYQDTALNLLGGWKRWVASLRGYAFSSQLENAAGHDDSETEHGVTSNRSTFVVDVWEQYSDIALLTVLIGVLAGIVNARQRRMLEMAAHQDLDDDGNGEDDEGNTDDDQRRRNRSAESGLYEASHDSRVEVHQEQQ